MATPEENRLAQLRKLIREELAQGLDRVNVHPKDETPDPAKAARARRFHSQLGLPAELTFTDVDDA